MVRTKANGLILRPSDSFLGLWAERPRPSDSFLGLWAERPRPTDSYFGLWAERPRHTDSYLGLWAERPRPTDSYLGLWAHTQAYGLTSSTPGNESPGHHDTREHIATIKYVVCTHAPPNTPILGKSMYKRFKITD